MSPRLNRAVYTEKLPEFTPKFREEVGVLLHRVHLELSNAPEGVDTNTLAAMHKGARVYKVAELLIATEALIAHIEQREDLIKFALGRMLNHAQQGCLDIESLKDAAATLNVALG